MFFWKVRLFWPSFLFICCFNACTGDPEIIFSGRTMGTTYNIKLVGIHLDKTEQQQIQTKVDDRLKEINQIMSTYIPDSEISLFNLNHSLESVTVSEEFAGVIQQSLKIYQLSSGRFDITVHPLVKIWGFGNLGPRWVPPPDSLIQITKAQIGSENLTLSENLLKKSIPALEVDLSAIAKGYGVDQIAQLLNEEGFQDFMVEIGGEVVCRGNNRFGTSWQIGIQYPDFTFSSDIQLIDAVGLSGAAMATSGNYRNFFEYDGQLYSHMIDPKTGYPVPNLLVSATVIADECITADALATSIMIMGETDGMEMIESLDNAECYLVKMDETGSMKSEQSSGFTKFLLN